MAAGPLLPHQRAGHPADGQGGAADGGGRLSKRQPEERHRHPQPDRDGQLHEAIVFIFSVCQSSNTCFIFNLEFLQVQYYKMYMFELISYL